MVILQQTSRGLLVLAVELRLQQRAEVGRTGRSGARIGLQAAHRFLLLGRILRLDRQVDAARLAIDVDHHRVDLLAFLQHVASVFDAILRDFRRTQVALDVRRQRDDRALRIDRLHDAVDDRTLVVHRDVVAERIAFELLDAERNAFLLDVDAEHDRLDFIALLVLADSLFAGFAPRQVRQVDEAVDAARQADEHAEIGDRLDRARDLVALLEVAAEVVPRIRLALLHAEADTTTIFVDLEHHDFDFVAELDNLRRSDVLVRPVHFRHVDEAFDARFHFDERAVVGDVRDLAEQARARRVTARDAFPRIVAQLLDAERHAVLLLVELEDLRGDFLADRQDFARVTHAAPCDVGDVQQAVDAAEVHERAVIGDVLDDAVDDRAFLERLEQLRALFALRGFDHRAARQHDVVTLAVELDHAELERLAFVRGRVLDGTRVDERARQERADAVDHHRHAALHLAGDRARDEFVVVERLFQRQPRSQTLRLVARQDRVAVAVFQRVDRDGNEIARLNLNLALIVQEFLDRNVGLGLQAGIDDHEVVVDTHDFGGDHFAGAHVLAGQRLFEQSRKGFGIRVGGLQVGHKNRFVRGFALPPAPAATAGDAPANPHGVKGLTHASRDARSTYCAFCPRSGGLAEFPVPREHLFDRLLDRQGRCVEGLGVRRRLERRGRAVAVARVALPQILEQVIYISRKTFLHQLLMPARGARLDARRQEYLQHRVREDHRPHVAAVRDEPGRLAKRALPRDERRAHARMDRDRRGPVADRLRADLVGHVDAVELRAALAERDVQAVDQAGERVGVVRLDLIADARERREPVQRAAVEQVKAEMRGDERRDGALAGRRRAVDRNNWGRVKRSSRFHRVGQYGRHAFASARKRSK
ncbi:hypothetical protein BURPS1710b_2994 [Burkholderia pseudomallei 1710b]|uniref:Uncharacterized protein n=1 Tax=Burkholderia pseudomallei (strain 1710b) TaxID=320372 RepID=Q3JPY1_BURP1|nr:hypothetical protein BURPS1710b_2994 [Burkholderia pseudomallei 1710b]